MVIRWMTVAIAAVLADAQAAQAFQARLYFQNLTLGTDNAGDLLVAPGDEVAIRFKFLADQPGVDVWGTLQAFIVLDGHRIMTDEQANTWAQQVGPKFAPKTEYPVLILWEPDYGPMCDFAIDPSDCNYPHVCDKGIYVLAGVHPWAPGASDFDKELFRFTVQPGSVGEVLDWHFDGRDHGVGLSTRIIGWDRLTYDITDNRVVVVPEPASLAAFLGFASLLTWRFRRSG